MKKNINTCFLALKFVLLFSASLHMIILSIFVFIKQDIGVINYFKLVGADLIFPSITTYRHTDTASLVFMALFYLAVFAIIKKRAP